MRMSGLRVLVADDHEIVRQGLVAFIASHRGWEVCGEAENGQMAVDKVKELKPDIAILDIAMPILNGLEATRQILRDNPRVKVLILTLMDAERVVQAARDAGARGYILKSEASRVLIRAVEALEYDNAFFTSRVARTLLGGYLEDAQEAKTTKKKVVPVFGPREHEVLQLVAKGVSTNDAARLLQMRPRTADTHRTNIMRKLKAHSVVGVMLYAFRNRILQVPVEKWLLPDTSGH
ncbi:MAG: response regulator transcription factor [Terriglobales bacterium]